MTKQRFRFRAGDAIRLSASGLALFDREERASKLPHHWRGAASRFTIVRACPARDGTDEYLLATADGQQRRLRSRLIDERWEIT